MPRSTPLGAANCASKIAHPPDEHIPSLGARMSSSNARCPGAHNQEEQLRRVPRSMPVGIAKRASKSTHIPDERIPFRGEYTFPGQYTLARSTTETCAKKHAFGCREACIEERTLQTSASHIQKHTRL